MKILVVGISDCCRLGDAEFIPVSDFVKAAEDRSLNDYDAIVVPGQWWRSEYICWKHNEPRPAIIAVSAWSRGVSEGKFIRDAAEFLTRCDDVVPADIEPRELIARIEAICRRTGPQSPESLYIKARDLTLDTGLTRVIYHGVDVTYDFTPMEIRFIFELAKTPGAVSTKERLLNRLYTVNDDVQLKIFDVFLCKVRKKLVRMGMEHRLATQIFETIWGRGYRFNDDDCLKRAEPAGFGIPDQLLTVA